MADEFEVLNSVEACEMCCGHNISYGWTQDIESISHWAIKSLFVAS